MSMVWRVLPERSLMRKARLTAWTTCSGPTATNGSGGSPSVAPLETAANPGKAVAWVMAGSPFEVDWTGGGGPSALGRTGRRRAHALGPPEHGTLRRPLVGRRGQACDVDRPERPDAGGLARGIAVDSELAIRGSALAGLDGDGAHEGRGQRRERDERDEARGGRSAVHGNPW